MEKSSPYPILNRLNGYKKVVLGNHDQPQHVKELLKYVNCVCGSFEYKGNILTHIPISESELYRYKRNIHGHLHENKLENEKYLNVSCEFDVYTPILLPL
jgi:calcineurin-like phosphoesterase family protein